MREVHRSVLSNGSDGSEPTPDQSSVLPPFGVVGCEAGRSQLNISCLQLCNVAASRSMASRRKRSFALMHIDHNFYGAERVVVSQTANLVPRLVYTERRATRGGSSYDHHPEKPG